MLRGCNIIIMDVSTIWEDKYGCTDKYIIYKYSYLLSILAHEYNIIIYCDKVSQGHCEDFIYEFNSTIKIIYPL